MLLELRIENILLIESLVIPFQSGMTAITGQTGAGKSIILESIGIILGEKASNSLIRTGCDSGYIIAIFDVRNNKNVCEKLQEYGFYDVDKNVLMIKKVFNKSGTRIFINDIPATVGVVSTISAFMVEIYSQFENSEIFHIKKHLSILDDFLNNPSLIQAVINKYNNLQNAIKNLDDLQNEYKKLHNEVQEIEEFLLDLKNINIKEDEILTLNNRKSELQNSKRLTDAVSGMSSGINSMKFGYNVGKMQTFNQNISTILSDSPQSDIVALSNLINHNIEQFSTQYDVIAEQISQMEDLIPNNTYELDQIEERLIEINDFARKHRLSLENLPFKIKECEEKKQHFSQMDEMINNAKNVYENCKHEYNETCETLSQQRKIAAVNLINNVNLILKRLKMESAIFDIQFESRSEISQQGSDIVTFIGKTNSGMPNMPIHKIASGGELARFMLAFKAAMLHSKALSTIIFDEIDTGVSGDVAHAIGCELRRMSKNAQIVCVTHNPQTAACGHNHVLVHKKDDSNSTITQATVLKYEQKIEAIAKMMSGATITKEALQNATNLIDNIKNNPML
jgi:DNA repair protein RecN (Recombination protein N)